MDQVLGLPHPNPRSSRNENFHPRPVLLQLKESVRFSFSFVPLAAGGPDDKPDFFPVVTCTSCGFSPTGPHQRRRLATAQFSL